MLSRLCYQGMSEFPEELYMRAISNLFPLILNAWWIIDEIFLQFIELLYLIDILGNDSKPYTIWKAYFLSRIIVIPPFRQSQK